MTKFGFLALGAMVLAAPAQAAEPATAPVMAVLTGKVSSGIDRYGLFGPINNMGTSLVDQAYTLVFETRDFGGTIGEQVSARLTIGGSYYDFGTIIGYHTGPDGNPYPNAGTGQFLRADAQEVNGQVYDIIRLGAEDYQSRPYSDPYRASVAFDIQSASNLFTGNNRAAFLSHVFAASDTHTGTVSIIDPIDFSSRDTSLALSLANLTIFQKEDGSNSGLTAAEAYMPSGYDNGFVFDFSASQGVASYIDPLVATGYDYQVLAGANILSAIFPTIAGDADGFELFTLAGESLGTVANGGTFTFAGTGVSGFRLAGIDMPGLNPIDPTAFVTGLTFATDGAVSIRQTALTQEGVSAAVPEPTAWALMILGVGAVGTRLRRRRAATPRIA